MATMLVVWCIQPSYAMVHGVPTITRQVCSWPLRSLRCNHHRSSLAIGKSHAATPGLCCRLVISSCTFHNCNSKTLKVKRNRKKVGISSWHLHKMLVIFAPHYLLYEKLFSNQQLFYYQLIASRPKDLLHLGFPIQTVGKAPPQTNTDQMDCMECIDSGKCMIDHART